MRFYCPGDEIYIFGFSRGAYTARFLAEMLDYIGLLSHGNEEMISFAWKAFAQWQCRRSNTSPEGVKKKLEMYHFLKGFRETFSRPVRRIRFLGLFDTVNSVPRFETAWMERSKFPYTARTSAKVIRHAVSIDERRAKFRQDLIYQSDQVGKSSSQGGHHHQHHRQHHPHLQQQDNDPNERYRRRSSTVTLKPTTKAEQVEDRGRRPQLEVPEMDEMAPYRARSHSTRSRATAPSPGAMTSLTPRQMHTLISRARVHQRTTARFRMTRTTKASKTSTKSGSPEATGTSVVGGRSCRTPRARAMCL